MIEIQKENDCLQPVNIDTTLACERENRYYLNKLKNYYFDSYYTTR